MVLNRQGKRLSLSKHWEMSALKPNATKPETSRPLSSLISHFNNQRSTPAKPIIPAIKEISITSNNSFSEKSVKAFIQENKILNKAQKPFQVFPAFGPKSFRVETVKKTDLSEAFSRLVVSRQADTKSKPPTVNSKAAADLPVIHKRFVDLKPVEAKLTPPQSVLKTNTPTDDGVVPQNNLKKISQIFQASPVVEKSLPSLRPKSAADEASALTESPQDDGFVSFTNNCLTNTCNDQVFSNNEDDIDGFLEYSGSCLSLSCSSILPQSEYSADTLLSFNSLASSDINDLLGGDPAGEETDLDRTLNSDSLMGEFMLKASGDEEEGEEEVGVLVGFQAAEEVKERLAEELIDEEADAAAG